MPRLAEISSQPNCRFDVVQGPTRLTQYHICIKSRTKSIKQRYRSRNLAVQIIIDDEVKNTARQNNRTSYEPMELPCYDHQEENGKNRFCIDFRKIIEPDAYPLPQITAISDKLRGARYLTTLDLKNEYMTNIANA